MLHVERIVGNVSPELARLNPPIVRTKYIGPFDGAPDDFDVSFVFQTRANARDAQRSGVVERAAHLLLEALRGDGYPQDALTTFKFRAISEQEIRDAGGEWAFDRS